MSSVHEAKVEEISKSVEETTIEDDLKDDASSVQNENGARNSLKKDNGDCSSVEKENGVRSSAEEGIGDDGRLRELENGDGSSLVIENGDGCLMDEENGDRRSVKKVNGDGSLMDAGIGYYGKLMMESENDDRSSVVEEKGDERSVAKENGDGGWMAEQNGNGSLMVEDYMEIEEGNDKRSSVERENDNGSLTLTVEDYGELSVMELVGENGDSRSVEKKEGGVQGEAIGEDTEAEATRKLHESLMGWNADIFDWTWSIEEEHMFWGWLCNPLGVDAAVITGTYSGGGGLEDEVIGGDDVLDNDTPNP